MINTQEIGKKGSLKWIQETPTAERKDKNTYRWFGKIDAALTQAGVRIGYPEPPPQL